MKLPSIVGTIHKVFPVKQNKKGFSQAVVIHVPEKKNDDGDVLRKEHHYVINIWSNKQDDTRFLKQDHVNAACRAECYLHGERWVGNSGFEYSNRVKLDKWADEVIQSK